MENQDYELECGCVSTFVNGKHIVILCDEHDEEQDMLNSRPPQFTKMRVNREI